MPHKFIFKSLKQLARTPINAAHQQIKYYYFIYFKKNNDVSTDNNNTAFMFVLS